MKRLGFLCVAVLGMVFGEPAFAAELTRVASSFEDKSPFGMYLDFTFERTADRGVLTREWYQMGSLQDVTELRYQKYDTRLGIDVNLGIYKDLELHIGVPLVFQQDRNWFFAGGTNETNTTIGRNCALDPAGTQCADPGRGEGQLFQLPPYPGGLNSYRAGLGDFTFGIAWNPFVQKKDPSKPTWTLRFDYTAPTAAVLNPTVATGKSKRGNIGDKLHRYAFSTAVSRRISKYVEPYFQVNFTLAWRGPGAYSNCDDASPDRQGHPENCGYSPPNGKSGWTRAETGIKPVQTGGAIFGAELTAFEREDGHQRIAFDFRGFLSYFSEGRYYNEMSDLFGKLLSTSDYGQVGGQFGFIGQAAEFVILRAYVSLAYNSEHLLTNESFGKDFTGNGTVDVTEELNPNYDLRIDRVGRRFRMEQQFLFRLQATATFNF